MTRLDIPTHYQYLTYTMLYLNCSQECGGYYLAQFQGMYPAAREFQILCALGQILDAIEASASGSEDIVAAIEEQTTDLVAAGVTNTTDIVNSVSALRPANTYDVQRLEVPPVSEGTISSGWFSILYYAPLTNIGNATVGSTSLIPGASESFTVPAGSVGSALDYETFADQVIFFTIITQAV